MSEAAVLVGHFRIENAPTRKLVQRTFDNLKKSGYFPADRWLHGNMESGDFLTSLNTAEIQSLSKMCGLIYQDLRQAVSE